MVRTATTVLLAALLAAACGREAAPPDARQVVDIFLPLEHHIIEAVVPRHATLDGLLRQHDLPGDLVQAVVESARAVFDPRDLRANRPYRLVRSVDGYLREFEYQIDADRFLRVLGRDRLAPSRFVAEVLAYEKEISIVAIRGAIDAERNSLIAAVTHAGEDVNLAISLADVFGGQIDFQSDLQPGDSVEVLFEKSTREGQFAGYGAILGARIVNDGREYQAYRWVNPVTQKAGFYDEEGRSLKRTLLKSPLKFEPRITSGFTRRRFHPVHRSYRPHLGVDYAAPTGAPVVAIAAGVVVSAGWAGGGGNQVRLRHAGGLESYYLHLSSFARGIRAGTHVDQGQLIGRVGATGTATGPHLDYRLRKNGVFVDPRREHARQPPGDPIPTVQLAGYRAARDGVARQMTSILLADAEPKAADAVKAGQ